METDPSSSSSSSSDDAGRLQRQLTELQRKNSELTLGSENLGAVVKKLKADKSQLENKVRALEEDTENLRAHSSNLEDALNIILLKAKECQLNELLNEREDSKRELLEKSASVERALREADNLDAQLEETKKAMATQKSSHEFHMELMESLSGDHKCLMDLVDEMKADLAAAKADNRRLKQHLEALKVDLTTTVRRKEEAEKKAGERREWATSPNRLEELSQEKEALVSRQSDLLDKIAKYESGRQEREREISELKARAESMKLEHEADSLLLHEKYESLKTELDYAYEINASAVVAMATCLQDANVERRRLEEERRNLMSDEVADLQ